MVSVVVTKDDVRSKSPSPFYLVPDSLVHRHLGRVRRPAVADIPQGDAGVDEYRPCSSL